jgi:hypothetical protein
MSEANWPDPERPGVPMFAERDGLHVIRVSPVNFVVRHWSAKYRHYSHNAGWRRGISPEAMADFFYVGPCLTQAEIAELQATGLDRQRASS